MKETYSYGGHSISLSLTALPAGRVSWTYFIDERYCFQQSTDLMSVDDGRASALSFAHESVDALNAFGRSAAAPSRPR